MGHRVASLHGGMPQRQRNRVLHGLRTRDLQVLVATDVAARGLDVPSISHVINYGLPMKAEDYVHRIGRTGRAGRSGLAVTLAERRDAGMIHNIQRFTTQRIPAAVVEGLEPKRPEPQSQTKPLRSEAVRQARLRRQAWFRQESLRQEEAARRRSRPLAVRRPGAQALRAAPDRPALTSPGAALSVGRTRREPQPACTRAVHAARRACGLPLRHAERAAHRLGVSRCGW